MAALKHRNNLGGYHQLILLSVLFPYLCPFLFSPCPRQTPNFICILSSHFFQGNVNNAQGKGLASMEPTAPGMTDSSQISPSLAEPELSHQISTLHMETGAVAAADWNR